MKRTGLAILAAALALAGAAAFVWRDAARDQAALQRIEESLDAAVPADRARVLRSPAGLEAVRGALLELKAMEDAPVWRHAWLHTRGRAAVERARGSAAAALTAIEGATVQRARSVAWVASVTERVERATLCAEIEAVQTELERGGAAPAPPADAALRAADPAGLPVEAAVLADLQARAAARAREFAQEDRRNVAVIDAARRVLESTGADPAQLLAVMDLALPEIDRRAPSRSSALDALRAQARAQRAGLLLERLGATEARGNEAISSRMVQAQLRGLERDGDLKRPADAALEAAIARTRQRLAARIDALQAWEAGRAALERSLAECDITAAAEALSSLTAVDDRTRQEAQALRAGFSARAANALERCVAERGEQGEWANARRLVDGVRGNAAVWALLDASSRILAERTARELSIAEDRSLYEAFRAAPCFPLAQRYLEGWPLLPRRLAPLVSAWLQRASQHGVAWPAETGQSSDRVGPPLPPWRSDPTTRAER